MERFQAFKYELMPSVEHVCNMRRFAGARRFVYNKALALQKERYDRGEQRLSYAELSKQLTVWRHDPETPWLKDAPAQTLQQTLMDLGRAYTNFFVERAGLPRFKQKGRGDSFRYPTPSAIKLDQVNSRIFLPKLGWLRYRNSREVIGEVRNATVSLSGGKWFVSILTQREVETPLPQGAMVGIDLGVVRFATFSDGSHIDPLNSYKKQLPRLVRYQRKMDRKKMFSNNWKKAKAKVQRIHTHAANARRDFLHKASLAISQNHAIVVIEDLQVQNMTKSAAGFSESPGHNVRAKSKLNRSILDQGWYEFRRQLGYKLAWHGGRLIAVPSRNTSRTCPSCSHVSADNRKSQARFECVKCGYENHADYVGAINVLAAGHAVLACGELVQSGHSVKQEPAEATQFKLDAG